MREHIEVSYSGDRADEGPLAWGQQAFWDAMASNRQAWNNGSVLDLADLRADVPAAVDAFARLLRRHEPLRTLIRVDDGTLRQVVTGSGVLPVLVERVPAAEAATTAERLLDDFRGPAFTPDRELPLRVGLVVVDELVRYVVLVYYHVMADFTAAQVVQEDLRQALATGSFARPAGLAPLDLARWEQRAGAPTTQRAVGYWSKQLRRIPPAMFDSAGPPHEPHTQQSILTSPALWAATDRLAARHRTTPGTVLATAIAMVLSGWTGHPVVAMNTHVGNRFGPDHSRMVSCLVQLGLFVLDVPATATLHDLVQPAAHSLLLAYRYAYCDPRALDRAREGIDADRGAQVNPLCCYNNMGHGPGAAEGAEGPSDREILAMRAESTLVPGPELPPSLCRFCLSVGNLSGDVPSILLAADTSYLPPERIDRFLREIENVLVTALVGPGPEVGALRG